MKQDTEIKSMDAKELVEGLAILNLLSVSGLENAARLTQAAEKIKAVAIRIADSEAEEEQ